MKHLPGKCVSSVCVCLAVTHVIYQEQSGMKGGNESSDLKGVFAKDERGYSLNAIKKRFWSLLILLLSVASIRRKQLTTTNTEEGNVHTNSERCNIQLGS